MKITNRLFIMGTMCLTSMGTQAAQIEFEEHDYNCEQQYLEDSFECSVNAMKTEKQRLNSIYMDIYRNLSSAQKQQMDNKQIAWNNKRDANCGVEENREIINNQSVWEEIYANMCVAYETQELAKYYANDFSVASLVVAVDFREVKRDGTLTYYKGQTVVRGTFNISSPDDDYTPCAICFSVDDVDSYKIPRDLGDTRRAWFAFDNTKRVNNNYVVSKLTVRNDRCYEPIKATIKIKDYIADTAETETVDKATLIDVISMQQPKEVACEF